MTTSILISIFLFGLGFVLLVGGSHYLIKGASSVARIFKLPAWVIGISIVGIGTSLPEFSINLASVFDTSTVGLATVLGSNTFNTLFILGLAAIAQPLIITNKWAKTDFTINVFAIAISLLFAIFPVIGADSDGGIGRSEGAILLSLFVIWLLWIILGRRGQTDEELESAETINFWLSVFLILAGIVGVFFGGSWVVDGAVKIASLLGVSESVIGLTIVAIGTSVPEIAVSLTAAIERRPGIAVGNIVGSNIFDFLWILGSVSILRPIAFPPGLLVDSLVTLGATLLLVAVARLGSTMRISRKVGLVFILLYLTYLAFVIYSG